MRASIDFITFQRAGYPLRSKLRNDFLPAHVDGVAVATQTDVCSLPSIVPVHTFNGLLLRQYGLDTRIAITYVHQIAGSRVSVNEHSYS